MENIFKWSPSEIRLSSFQLDLGKVLNKLDIGQITAFTATAARTTIDHIKTHVFCGSPVHLIQGNPDRPNITYQVIPTLMLTS